MTGGLVSSSCKVFLGVQLYVPGVTLFFSHFILPIDALSLSCIRPNRLLARLDEVANTVYSPDRGDSTDGKACDKAINDYNGYWGPFID